MDSPAFGQADLTNCERELIHLAGSVQPHGALLLLREDDLVVLQASANCGAVLGVPAARLLERPLAELDAGLAHEVATRAEALAATPLPLLATLDAHPGAGPGARRLEGTLHRPPGGGLVLELERIDDASAQPPPLDVPPERLRERLAQAVQRFTEAASVGALVDAMAQVLRDLTGYDRVMIYRFDPDGHGKIVAEARDPRLDSLLGHHYPASDIPQRARQLYLLNRVRVLVDVHYTPAPLLPALRPDSGEPLDMSLCHLRSMSPLHLQYLKNMGVTGTLVASLVRDGRLWGLIAAHHYSPRRMRFAVRAAVDLLAEVASTRIAAIENYAHAQVALMVRRLEQRLIEATSVEGDWRQALLRNPRTLLQPLEASGAALFHGDEVLTTGEVPSTPELRALLRWVDAQPGAGVDGPFGCSALGSAEPSLATLSPTACGVLAVRLSTSRPDWLMWLRKEQLQTVTWAGEPAKAIDMNDPLQLSPRRSFEAWSEIVRGTAMPWSQAERVMAGAIGTALVDIIVQVHAVRMLIAEHQLAEIRAAVAASLEAVLVAGADGALLFANPAFTKLHGAGAAPPPGTPLAALFEQPDEVRHVLETTPLAAWRGEWALVAPGGSVLPVAAHLEPVPGRGGVLLGYIVTLADLRDRRRTAEARRHLEAALQVADAGAPAGDSVVGAIFTNASLAAMDIADGAGGTAAAAPLLQELEASAQRAAALYAQIRGFGGGG
ncbi:MAG: GAF domain-containing protein [Rubrivivax sp.]|nr:GAF domain-containing protein [Rubrivivax sp.]